MSPSPRAPGVRAPSGTSPLSPTAKAIVARDRRALGRLISEVEAGNPACRSVLRELHDRTGQAIVVGVTGPLGVGKSSLINLLLRHLRSQGKRVGIVAVDPSSPFSGGAVLGDRIRIEREAGDPDVFFRSMASRGHAGGLSQSTREVVRLLEAYGMDVVLLETVGSGQVDVEVHSIATTRVVVLVPHLGDEVQTLKAGLFEIADIFAVNKADLSGADRAARDLTELASLTPDVEGWHVRVVQTSTLDGRGVPALWEAIQEHERTLRSSASSRRRALARAEQELRTLLHGALDQELADLSQRSPEYRALVEGMVEGTLDPYAASAKAAGLARRSP